MKVGYQADLPLGRIDAVITQRGGPVDAPLGDIVSLLRQIRARRIPLIYDLDDDLLTPHPIPHIESAIAARRTQTHLLLREADAVIVSTKTMADRIKLINKNVYIWENSIDDGLINPFNESIANNSEGADIGYVGTQTHLKDLMSVLGSLEKGVYGLAYRPSVEFLGVSDDIRIAKLLSWSCNVKILPVIGDYNTFLQTMQCRPHWKVGLAPLADNLFNRSKSDIKFLDYAVSGVVGVYSDTPVYASVVDGVTGFLAAPDQFGTVVRRLLEDPEARHVVRRQAREYVLNHRVLSRQVPNLVEIVQQVLDRG